MDKTGIPIWILLGLLFIWEIIGFGLNGTFIWVFFLFIFLSCFLGFIIQSFSSKWDFSGTTRNFIIFFCISALINILITISYRF